jgi:predicted Zn finger-like uncharacterized protein
MILTCPACDTKYVVKDGAIPPAGRQVRCASCKHSWHQDSELVLTEEESGSIDFGGPPPPSPDASSEPVGEIPDQAETDDFVAETPEPLVTEQAEDGWAMPSTPGETNADPVQYEPVSEAEPEAAEAADWQPPEPVEEDFAGYSPITDEAERRSGWQWLIGLLILVVAAAAAFWFLAPDAWKAKAGIAAANATPLQLMITTSDRQPLESGNELVAISGRVINPTDQEQNVPPIRAELRDKQTHAVVHRWTIAPPARVLAPRSSASFNSAEVDVPKGGDELTVTLGG